MDPTRSTVRLHAVLSLALLGCLLPARAQAVDYFVCDCASGANAQCQPGSDSANGTSAATPWQSYERARTAFNATLNAGDSVNFCRGGAFALGMQTQWVNPRCQAGQRCIIGSYAPPWANAGMPHPRLRQTAGNGFSFADAGGANHEEGYLVRDLELSCSACGDGHWGVFIYNDTDQLRMERLVISGFSIGVHLAGSQACETLPVDPACDARNDGVELVQSDVLDNSNQGWLGSGSDLLLADNRFIGNGSGTVFQHSVYLTQSGGATTNMRVLRNEITRSVINAQGQCEGGAFASHGEHTGLVIEGNLVHEDVGVAQQACWGIGMTPAYATPEYFRNAIVRGNTIRNMGNIAIAIGSCTDCIIENNVIVHEQSFGLIAIAAPAVAPGAGDALLDHLTVRNNSIYTGVGNSVGVRIGAEGDEHVVVSNAIDAGAAPNGSFACFSFDAAVAAFDAVDNNVCAPGGGAMREWEQGSGALAAWQGASGLDASSLALAPGFIAPAGPSFDLRASDANAAMVDAGHPSLSAPMDWSGAPRTIPDAGAHEFGSEGHVFANGFEG